MKTEQLQAFCNVCHYMSFAKAAEATFISRSALMRAINALEKELGCTLFLRTPKGLKLTPQGQEVLQRATEIVHACDELLLSIGHKPSNTKTILIGVTGTHANSYAVIRCIRIFNSMNNGYQAHVVTWDRMDAETAILDGRLDCYFATTPPQDSRLSCTPIVNQNFVLLSNINSPYARKGEILCEQLINERLVMTSFSSRPQEILEARLGASIESCIEYRTTDLGLIYRMVSDGLVSAILTPRDAYAGTILYKNIVTVVPVPKIIFQMGLLYRKGADKDDSIKMVIDVLKENYEQEYIR